MTFTETVKNYGQALFWISAGIIAFILLIVIIMGIVLSAK